MYDTSAQGEQTGDRTVADGELVIGGGNATAASLAWEIAFNGSVWHYSYSFSENSQQSISHFVLDLSDTCTATAGCLSNVVTNSTKLDLEYGTFDSGNGNPNFPGQIVGVKFDELSAGNPFTFSFDSNRAPVYGDFYTKGGNGGTNGFAVYNAGAANHLSEDITDFIARPDTIAAVPEPGTLVLLGTGLIALGLRGRNRITRMLRSGLQGV